ncbi:hypothetical protein ACP70R_049043 [Stipagrostis hirtigluma subsp. patula]
MVFALSMVLGKWVAVAWDFKRRQMNVYAPRHRSSHDDEKKWAAHLHMANKLHDGLRLCVQSFFDVWQIEGQSWPKVLIDHLDDITDDGHNTW